MQVVRPGICSARLSSAVRQCPEDMLSAPCARPHPPYHLPQLQGAVSHPRGQKGMLWLPPSSRTASPLPSTGHSRHGGLVADSSPLFSQETPRGSCRYCNLCAHGPLVHAWHALLLSPPSVLATPDLTGPCTPILWPQQHWVYVLPHSEMPHSPLDFKTRTCLGGALQVALYHATGPGPTQTSS